jgi:hypothetical protein
MEDTLFVYGATRVWLSMISRGNNVLPEQEARREAQ